MRAWTGRFSCSTPTAKITPSSRPVIRFGSRAIAGLRSLYGDAARRRLALLWASYCLGADHLPPVRWALSVFAVPPGLFGSAGLRCLILFYAPLSDVRTGGDRRPRRAKSCPVWPLALAAGPARAAIGKDQSPRRCERRDRHDLRRARRDPIVSGTAGLYDTGIRAEGGPEHADSERRGTRRGT